MTGSTATVFEINTDAAEPEPPPMPVRIDGVLYLLRRPKVSIAVGLVSLMEGGIVNPDAVPAEVGARLVDVLWTLVHYFVPEDPEPMTVPGADGEQITNPQGGQLRGRGRLIQRLRSADDKLDILDLAPLFERVARTMFDRPTGPSPASSARQDDGGTASAEGTPEPQAATSGT